MEFRDFSQFLFILISSVVLLVATIMSLIMGSDSSQNDIDCNRSMCGPLYPLVSWWKKWVLGGLLGAVSVLVLMTVTYGAWACLVDLIGPVAWEQINYIGWGIEAELVCLFFIFKDMRSESDV